MARRLVHQKLKLAREKVAFVSVKRKEFIKKRRKAVEELGIVSEKYKKLESWSKRFRL